MLNRWPTFQAGGAQCLAAAMRPIRRAWASLRGGVMEGMKLIILDRDGVINHDSDAFIKSPDEWIPIPVRWRRSPA
jgi:hypothetical protein